MVFPWDLWGPVESLVESQLYSHCPCMWPPLQDCASLGLAQSTRRLVLFCFSYSVLINL